MNIKSRIGKLENQIIKPDSEFCSCSSGIVTFLILPTLGDKSPTEDEQPDICTDCLKPIHRQTIKPATFNINTNVNERSIKL